jgi:RNA polymerase sigma factor (sigma-70 family)
MRKSRSSRSHIDIAKEVKEARTLKGRKRLREEIEFGAIERDVVEWTDQVNVSPYWDHAAETCYDEEGEIKEQAAANPDYVKMGDYNSFYPKPFHSEKIERLYKKLNVEEKMKLLTDKEKEVLEMLSNGYSQKEVAKLLGNSDGRISNIVNNIKTKLKN